MRTAGKLILVDDLGNGDGVFACICGNAVIRDIKKTFIGKRSRSCGCGKGKTDHLKSTLRSLKKSFEHPTLVLTKLGNSQRSRNWGFKCTICGVSKENLCRYEVLSEGHKFCKCSNYYKSSREECLQELKDYLETQNTWSLVEFPKEYKSKKGCRPILKCNKCGYSDNKGMMFHNIVKWKGCRSCMLDKIQDLKSKDLSYFLEKSHEKHGDRYDYSKVVYVKCRLPVEIFCTEHGSFWQSPDNHYNKGKGCPKCRNERLRHVHFHRSRVDANKDLYQNLPSGVYLMKVGCYWKIGMSVKVDKRSKEIRNNSKLPVEILHYREMDMFNAFHLEYNLHEIYEEYNSNISGSFQGASECFNLNGDQIGEVMQKIDDWEVSC